MQDQKDARLFEEARPTLVGLAYRILGSRADAEDAVQDIFLKWQAADRGSIKDPLAWLTTLCTRRCIDLLRSAHKARVEYVGPWLPEPIPAPVADTPEEQLSLASSLTTAFLLLLERLTPKERAAYLLHEIFEMPYPEVARTLDIQEPACRKLISRARANVEHANVRHVTPIDRQEQLLGAFQNAIAEGRMEPLATLLSEDIELCVDSGGKVPALQRVLRGRREVLDFIARGLHQYWSTHEWIVSDINAARGVVLKADGAVTAAASFAYDEQGRVTNIYVVRNPEKLAGLAHTLNDAR